MRETAPFLLLLLLSPAFAHAAEEGAAEPSGAQSEAADEAGEVSTEPSEEAEPVLFEAMELGDAESSESGEPDPEEEDLDLFGSGGEEAEEVEAPAPGLRPFFGRTGAERDDGVSAPVYENWWFWAAIAGAAVLTGGVLVAGGSRDTVLVDPHGSLGTIDWRR